MIKRDRIKYIIFFSVSILFYFDIKKDYSKNIEENKPDKLIEDYTLTSSTGKSQNNEAKRFNKKGVRFKTQGKYNDAIEYFDKAIRIDPKYGVALVNRANTQIILGKYNKAVQDSSKAIKISPEFSYAYIARGWAYHFLEKDNLSLSDAQKSFELAPNIVDSYFILGANFEAVDDYLEAVKIYDLAIKKDPKNSVSYYKLAKIYFDLEDYEKVKNNCLHAVKLNNSNRNRNISNFCSQFISIDFQNK